MALKKGGNKREEEKFAKARISAHDMAICTAKEMGCD